MAVQVFSKLQTGRVPHLDELITGLEMAMGIHQGS